MEEAITALLLGNASVSAIVADRVNWSARPDDADLPAITLHRVAGAHGRSLTGRTGLTSSKVQIDCWGTTFRTAKLLGRAVVPALPHARSTTGGIVLQGVFIESESDTVDQTDPDEPLYRTRIEISVWHEEANDQ